MTTTETMSPEDRAAKRRDRRKAILAWGSLAGVGALITAAAFLDNAYLNIGNYASGDGGIGPGTGDGTKAYNLQVGATDEKGEFIEGWQEADDPAGVPVNLPGADSIMPGGEPRTVTIPVRNDSAKFGSTLGVNLNDRGSQSQLFRDTLRFKISDPDGRVHDNLSFTQLQKAVELTELAPYEESSITFDVWLPTSENDNALNGQSARLQMQVSGSSIEQS
ncbi:hypothetical protein NBM05_02140 [Rothia sp. AR01]|uniref:Uncharacterized protein n=1 Tax=Rothia santali TaxID=2949643 RepID=A0A9X2HFM1_9MICC|nr:hypothetical protein [Rothia santali]MCP3424861.1 hypothetical protein [Rothia santali]